MKEFFTDNQKFIELVENDVNVVRTGREVMYVTDANAIKIEAIAKTAGIDDYSICSYNPRRVMCSFNLYREKDRYHGNVWVEYRAIARDENQVRELAEEAGYDIDGMVIEIDQFDAKDQLGRPYSAKIWSE